MALIRKIGGKAFNPDDPKIVKKVVVDGKEITQAEKEYIDAKKITDSR